MTRVKRGIVLRKNHKKIIKSNQGFFNSQSKLFKIANQEYIKSLNYSYTSRIKRKCYFRTLWIKRINGTTKSNINIKYNTLICKLKKNNIILNRKVLSELAYKDKGTFLTIFSNI